MAEIIREYRAEDRAALIELWSGIFGDKEEYISYFLDNLPAFGVGAVGECDGRAVSMAYAVTGLSYMGKSVGYIYAVATDENYRGRGLGEKVSRKAAELSKAEIITTFPAEDSLYDWYEKILGTDNALHTRIVTVKADKSGGIIPVSAAKYNSEREKLLKYIPHVSLTDAAARLEEKLCTTYGGGLFRCREAIIAAYLDGSVCYVREALGGNIENAASALAAYLGAEEAKVRIADAGGERFAAIPDGAMDEKTVWNITFD